jgi:RNA polymerase sigma-70 factor (ECF subfamily)
MPGEPPTRAAWPSVSAVSVPADDRAALKAMDEASFRILYEKTARRLWAYLHHSCRNPATADDLLQDTFCRFLCAKLPSMDEQQTRSYLFRIATNLLHDRRPSMRDPAPAELPELPYSEDTDSRVALRAAFQKLGLRERQLLWLAHVEGFDHHEISAALRIGRASVRVLLFRARRKLAIALEARAVAPSKPGEL